MPNPLEHAEHISHANHEHGEGGHEDHSKLGTYIGITMAVLGVVLAYCAAKVGAERTELIQALVEQQHAHSKYEAQDIKHRVAVSNLRHIHAAIPAADLVESLDANLEKLEGGKAGVTATTAAARALGKNLNENVTPNKADAADLAATVDRYLAEAAAANEWVESFDPAIKAHVVAQERYELGQLMAEVGIVIASVALLINRRLAWFVAIGLGAGAVGIVGITLAATTHTVHEAEVKIEETGKEYRDLRTADKAKETDEALLAAVRKWAGVSAPPAHQHQGSEKPAHHE